MEKDMVSRYFFKVENIYMENGKECEGNKRKFSQNRNFELFRLYFLWYAGGENMLSVKGL